MAVHFAMHDNPTLTRDYIEDQKRRHSGIYLRRNVYGEWVAASGLVYPHPNIKYPPEGEPDYWYLAIDAATSSVTVALLIGFWSRENVSCVVGEWYHDGRQDGQLSDAAQADGIIEMVGSRELARICVDPKALSLIAELKRRMNCPVEDADNAVEAGIERVTEMMAADYVRISPALEHTCREVARYRWSEHASDRGEDKVEKRDDHCMDALRYYVMTFLRRIKRGRIRGGRRRAA